MRSCLQLTEAADQQPRSAVSGTVAGSDPDRAQGLWRAEGQLKRGRSRPRNCTCRVVLKLVVRAQGPVRLSLTVTKDRPGGRTGTGTLPVDLAVCHRTRFREEDVVVLGQHISCKFPLLAVSLRPQERLDCCVRQASGRPTSGNWTQKAPPDNACRQRAENRDQASQRGSPVDLPEKAQLEITYETTGVDSAWAIQYALEKSRRAMEFRRIGRGVNKVEGRQLPQESLITAKMARDSRIGRAGRCRSR